jgi:hypothetical protein
MNKATRHRICKAIFDLSIVISMIFLFAVGVAILIDSIAGTIPPYNILVSCLCFVTVSIGALHLD